MSYDKIPQELKDIPQWVCWSLEPDHARPGEFRKIPKDPNTRGNAKSNDPDTWSDYETAVKASEQFTGIGFMFTEGLIGIDIDGVRDEIDSYLTGQPEENIVREFIETCQSYTEISQSGNGIHIICQGNLPDGRKRKGNVEIYTSGRFFIMTGETCSPYTEIAEAEDQVKYLRSKYLSDDVPAYSPSPIRNISANTIIELIENSSQGPAFRNFMAGSWEGYYSSQSEADLAFCNMLARWSDKNKSTMDEIFRSSGLMRPKWDQMRGESTYGSLTLDKAIQDTRTTYRPQVGDWVHIAQGGGQKPKRFYSHDDTGNSQMFQDLFEDVAKYSYSSKSWFIWDGRRWREDPGGNIKKLANKLLSQLQKDRPYEEGDEDARKAWEKHVKYSRSSSGKERMIKEAAPLLDVNIGDFDRHDFLLNVSNGTLGLQTGELSDHEKGNLLTMISDVEYTDKVDTPQWNKFLDEIFVGDQDLVRYVQKAVGYSLTGSTAEQCMFFCYGDGSNGKSTFLDVIRDIAGEYSANAQSEVLMFNGNKGGPTPEIARLKGKRFVTTNESNEGTRLDEALIKQLTGGDIVTTRFLYGSDFEYVPNFKLWMATNHKPIIRGRDEGIWRRIALIPFLAHIPDSGKDKNLKYKLRKEAPGILSWALHGCKMWQREGLERPAVMQEAVNEYKSEMDVVYAFLSECTCPGPGWTKASELYRAYARWANENGEYKMSNTKFGSEISKRYAKTRKSSGIHYEGVRINAEYVENWVNVMG